MLDLVQTALPMKRMKEDLPSFGALHLVVDRYAAHVWQRAYLQYAMQYHAAAIGRITRSLACEQSL